MDERLRSMNALAMVSALVAALSLIALLVIDAPRWYTYGAVPAIWSLTVVIYIVVLRVTLPGMLQLPERRPGVPLDPASPSLSPQQRAQMARYLAVVSRDRIWLLTLIPWLIAGLMWVIYHGLDEDGFFYAVAVLTGAGAISLLRSRDPDPEEVERALDEAGATPRMRAMSRSSRRFSRGIRILLLVVLVPFVVIMALASRDYPGLLPGFALGAALGWALPRAISGFFTGDADRS